MDSKPIYYFTIGYLIVFTILSVIHGNFEFLYYIFIMTIFITITLIANKKLHLTLYILMGLSILGFMNVAGGNLWFNGTRLYEIYLIKNILRYDNIVHSFGTFVGTFVAYNIIKPHIDKKIKYNRLLLSLILILMAMGFGAFIEVLEFGAVIFFGAAKQVGDYFNNTLDLLFNLIGSAAACFFIHPYHKKQRKNV